MNICKIVTLKNFFAALVLVALSSCDGNNAEDNSAVAPKEPDSIHADTQHRTNGYAPPGTDSLANQYDSVHVH